MINSHDNRKGRMGRIPGKSSLFLILIFIFILIPSVFAYDNRSSEGTESIISTTSWGTDQIYPAIWKDRIVWTHYYPDPEDPEWLLSDIYLYNLTTGEMTKVPTGLPYQEMPDIWEDLIVWQTVEEDNYEIHLFNFSNGQELRLTNDQVHQIKPKIWGNWIVWQEGFEEESETKVYLYSIDSGNVKQLGDSLSSAKSPAIWEDRVVWEDSRNGGGNLDIYYYNITTGEERQITTDTSAQTSPSIWGDAIVWLDNRDISNQIYLLNLGSGNETCITSGNCDLSNPVISGEGVGYFNDTVVSLIDLTTLKESQISSDGTGSYKQNLDSWENSVVWADMRNGDFDIFLYTIGISMAPLNANFSTNVTQGNAPLTVAFFDNTSGQVGGWRWDFGDGGISDEQQPVHTYDSDGSYSVALTVHNPYQRDATRKDGFISVGSEPVPQFTQNLTSGPVPLIVQFSDESSGLPTGWQWDFGDSEQSYEQNPLHIFTQPGVYDVSLMVSNIFGSASVTKSELVTVMDATYFVCTLPSEGIQIQNTDQLILNTTLAGNCIFDPDEGASIILFEEGEESGIAQIRFMAQNGTKFVSAGNDTLTGTISNVIIRSYDMVPLNFSQETGNQCSFNFTISTDQYEPGGMIHSVAWEGSTPDDFNQFDLIALGNNSILDHIAYSIQFKEDLVSENQAIVVFGVNSDWVDQYGWRWCHQIESDPPGAAVFVDSQYVGDTPICIEEGLSPGNHTVTVKEVGYYPKTFPITIDDKRDSIHVIRIGDDGTGEVLNTTFIGHDPERNLDFFRAESPNGLSTFGLASLSKSGNILQLINLVISAIVSGGGGGGGGSSASTTLHSPHETAAPTPVASEPPETPSPLQEEPPGLGESPGPEVTFLPGDTSPVQEPPPPTTSGVPGVKPWFEGISSLIILRNISVIFVVIFITAVFFLRWKR